VTRHDAPRYESPEETEALAALREERSQAQHYRPWNTRGADAWVANHDPDLR
jgi:hypothetical protein